MDRNDLLAATRDEFLRAFIESVEKSIALSMEDFFHKADTTFVAQERNSYFDARRVLQDRGDELMQQMKKSMEQLLTRSLQTSYSTFRPSFSSTYSGSSLALLDSAVFEDELRINEIASQFRNETEENLRGLNIRVAHIFEQDDIQERENPFRPYLLARCIASAVEAMGELAALNAIIMEQLVANMVDSIDDIYGRLNTYLLDQGIAVHLKLKIKKSKSQFVKKAASVQEMQQGNGTFGGMAGSAVAGKLGEPQGSAPDALAAPRDQRMEQLLAALHGMVGNLSTEMDPDLMATRSNKQLPMHIDYRLPAETLRKFFSGETAQNDSSIATAAAAGMAEIESSPAAAPEPPGERKAQHEGLRNLIMELRTSPADRKLSPGDQMTVDVLAMLCEFILHDRQVPESIRVEFGRMQVLILQGALRDATLLTKKDHPVKKLINRIATISLSMQQIDPELKHLSAEVGRIVDALLAEKAVNVSFFQNMLDDFEAFVSRELHATPGKTGHAMQLADNAQELAIQFESRPSPMAQALSGLTLDAPLRDFLESVWVRPIQLAEQAQPARARRFKMLVPRLIWSSVPKISQEDRKQLFVMLPAMLRTIREGLSLLGWDADQQQTLLSQLVDIHTSALRVSDSSLVAPSLQDTYAHFETFTAVPKAGTASASIANKPMDDASFIDQAASESGIEVRRLDQMFDEKLSGAPVIEAGVGSFDMHAEEHLRSGTPVEISLADAALGEGPRQGMLLWLSPKQSHLVLMLANDSMPSTMCVSTLQRLLEAKRARFLEAAPLFERAVQSVLKSAAHTETSG